MAEKIVPRQGYPVYQDNQMTGQITSGGYAPFLQKSIGLFLTTKGSGMIELGAEVDVEIRHRHCRAQIIKLPFYRRSRPV